MKDNYKEITTSRKVAFEPDTEEKQVVEVTLEEATADTNPINEAPQAEQPKVEDRKVEQRQSRAQKRIKQLVSERDEVYGRLAEAERKTQELEKQMKTGSKQTKEALKATLEAQIGSLTKQMVDSIKNGEAEESVRLQDELLNAKLQLSSIYVDLSASNVEEPKAVQQPKTANQGVPEKALEWIDAHPEFKTDELFHGNSIMINNQLLREGFDAESDEFYEELDVRLAKRFPEIFGISKENGVELSQDSDSSKKGKSDVKTEAPKVQQTVSGSSRASPATSITSKKSQRVELSQADIAQADRWGLSMEQMARRIIHSEQNKRSDGYVPIMISKDK